MKIHSDILTESDIHAATRAAGMRGVRADVATRGSRSRKRRLDVKLTGTSNRRPNGGNRAAGPEDGYAATWDEWGMFIHALFEVDGDAIIGQYPTYSAFDIFTGGRFDTLTADNQHRNHKWEFVAPRQFQCKGCNSQQDDWRY